MWLTDVDEKGSCRMGREEAAPGESLRANEGAKDNEPAKEAEGAPNEFKGNTVIGGAKVSTSR